MKKIIKLLSVLILIFASIPWLQMSKVEAAESTTKLKILQLIDSSSTPTPHSALISDDNKFEITTMDMKTFVAERKDLDGLYDAIYIAKGNYDPALPANFDIEYYSGLRDKIWPWQKDLKGEYSKGKNKTENVMNDITELKANDIIEFYIKKGLPVYISETLENQSEETKKLIERKSILKDKLYPYVKDNAYKNVKAVKENKKIVNSKLNIEEDLLTYKDTRIKITSYQFEEKESLVSDKKEPFKKGDTLSIKFKVDNFKNINYLTTNLYIDFNYDNQFGETEVIETIKLKDLRIDSDEYYTIQYQLTNNYSGNYHWKLEIVDESTKLKDYKSDYFEFEGEKVIINVLQVIDNTGNNNLVTILGNMNKKDKELVFTNPDGETWTYDDGRDFEININVVSKAIFTTENLAIEDYEKNNKNLDKDKVKEKFEADLRKNYKSLNNGKYNMLIFGFSDSYGTNYDIFGDNEKKIINEVNDYIAQEKSIFFTHDTLFRGEVPEWVDNFLNVAAQNYEVKGNKPYETKPYETKPYETNMGYHAHTTATEANLVNKGLMTMYPFNLTTKEKIIINKTHAQYYVLNLEERDVIPWYNLYNGVEMKGNDAWNHYYTYSYKNITYSGAGHDASNGFEEDERELFINTMYRAFLGSNAAPTIEVIYPLESDKVYTYQKDIPIQFIPEDLDRDDRNLIVDISVNGKPFKENLEVYSGKDVSVNYPLNVDEKQLEIVIGVTDSKKNRTEKKWTVEVVKLEGIITKKEFVQNFNKEELNKSLSNGYIQPNTLFDLMYKMEIPKEINPVGESIFKEAVNFEYEFNEFIPEGFTINNLDELAKKLPGITFEKTANGTNIKWKLAKLRYSVENGKLVLDKTTESNIQFLINLKSVNNGNYVLDQTKLAGINDTKNVLNFNKLNLSVIDGLEDIIVDQNIYLRKEETKPVVIKYIPNSVTTIKDKLITGITWKEIGLKENKKLLTLSNDNLDYNIIKGNEKGNTKVNVTVRDIFGNEVNKEINVSVDTLNIIVDPKEIDLNIGDESNIQVTVTPDFAKVGGNQIDVGKPSNDNVTVESYDPNTQLITVKGIKPGDAEIIVSLNDDSDIEATVKITVMKPSLKEIKFDKPYYPLEPGEKMELSEILIFNPSSLKKADIVETLQLGSSLEKKVEVDFIGGKWWIIGLEVGTSLVTVKAPKQADGITPKPTSAYFEVKNDSGSNNNSSTNGKW